MRLFQAILLGFFIINTVSAQEAEDTTWFPEQGVYMSLESLQSGKPGYMLADLYKSQYDTSYTIREWSRSSRLLVTTSVGKKASIRDSIFCISEDGRVELYMGGRFHKVLEFGAICYFRESYKIVKDQMSPVVTETYGTADYRLLELNTGLIYDFNLSNVENLIRKDEELFREFKSIKSSKKRKNLMYLYIEKFNRRNPYHPGQG